MKDKPGSGVDKAWLNQQFNQVDDMLKVLLAGLADVKQQNNLILAEVKKLQPSNLLIPELETAILKNAVLTRFVDRKVPDQKKG